MSNSGSVRTSPSTSGLRPSIIEARQFLGEQREALRQLHEQGASGIEICQRWTGSIDIVVQEIYEEALADLPFAAADQFSSRVTLVAHGGYGRRDLAPYSDVDLLLLYHPAERANAPLLGRRLLADLSDVGVMPGFNTRMVRETCQVSWQDVMAFTSHAESRYLIGGATLFTTFMREFRRGTERRSHALIHRIRQARFEERKQFGDTVFLLQPNVKRSRGGLRDIHLLRWIGFARYLQWHPDRLERQGLISAHDAGAVATAYAYLLRLRNELHFHAGRPQDVLDRAEQLRIAELRGYPGTTGLLPVEQFMREYFAVTNDLRHAVDNFVESSYNPSLVESVITQLTTHRVDKHFLIDSTCINVTRKGHSQLLGNLAELLRLMELAHSSDKRIGQETWHAIRNDMVQRDTIEVTHEASRRFLGLLSHHARLGILLRRLHDLRVLERLVAGLDHARHLVQFNQYHKYTVDEHCILAVEKATSFLEQDGALGAAYRSIPNPSILHLALLIHDVGKGFAEDHSEVGRRFALETAERLHLDTADTELLTFLVHRHLMMAHLAFRRDISDVATVVKFAAEVGSPEYLRALFVVTAADLAAVGPDVLNPWKLEVLTELYLRTQNYLAGQHEYSARRADQVRGEVLKLTPDDDPDWFSSQVRSLPDAYVLENPPNEIAGDLLRLRELKQHAVLTWGRYDPDRHVSIYSVGFQAGRARGMFHRVAAAFSSQGMNILAASIYTLANQEVLARIFANDVDFAGEPPAARFEQVAATVVDGVENPSPHPPAFRQRWQDAWRDRRAKLEVLPTRVLVDQSSRSDVTILDIFAHDRIGLLYTIAKTLSELKLLVHFAKISTYLDQVLSVFYVTDLNRQKIMDDAHWESIRATLLERIETE